MQREQQKNWSTPLTSDEHLWLEKLYRRALYTRFRTDDYNCCLAAIALATRISYLKVRQTFLKLTNQTNRLQPDLSVKSDIQLKSFLKVLGYNNSRLFTPRAKSSESQLQLLSKITSPAILTMEARNVWHQMSDYTHCVVWYPQCKRLLDTYHGYNTLQPRTYIVDQQLRYDIITHVAVIRRG